MSANTLFLSAVREAIDAGFTLAEARVLAADLAPAAVSAESPVAEATSPKGNRFYDEVIAARVPCAMGPGGKPVKGCTRRFAPNGSGATNHLRHGK